MYSSASRGFLPRLSLSVSFSPNSVMAFATLSSSTVGVGALEVVFFLDILVYNFFYALVLRFLTLMS